jgi:pSer/pThr/pTyr-binding forkhead associated (FHA) protein
MGAQLIGKSQNWKLAHAGYVLGRSGRADLRIEEPLASRQHCWFFLNSDAYYVLTDLGSRNGTYVNGELLAAPRVLRNRDLIQIGSQEIIFDGNYPRSKETGRLRDRHALRTPTQVVLMACHLRELPKMSLLEPRHRARAAGQWFGSLRQTLQPCQGMIDLVEDRSLLVYWAVEPATEAATVVSAVQCAKSCMQSSAALNQALRTFVPQDNEPGPWLEPTAALHLGLADVIQIDSRSNRHSVQGVPVDEVLEWSRLQVPGSTRVLASDPFRARCENGVLFGPPPVPGTPLHPIL